MKFFLYLVPLLFVAVGCGTDSAKLVPVTGTLKIDGQPVGGIMVQFMPEILDENISAPTSQALTDSSGNFDLFTLQNERGAVVGKHRVSLFDTEEERVEQGEVETRPRRLDPKFASGFISVAVNEGVPVQLEASAPK